MAVSRVAAGHDRTRLTAPDGRRVSAPGHDRGSVRGDRVHRLAAGRGHLPQATRDRRRQGTQPAPRTRTRIRDPAGRRRRAHAHRPGDARCHRPLTVGGHRPGRWRPVCGQDRSGSGRRSPRDDLADGPRSARPDPFAARLPPFRRGRQLVQVPAAGRRRHRIPHRRRALSRTAGVGVRNRRLRRGAAARRRRAGGVPDRAGGADECAQARRQRGASACEPAARGT